MSKELIDRNLFVKSINESIAAAHKWGASAQDDEIKIRAEQAIATFCEASLRAKQMPTIDAVEVVRCKDCKHLEVLNVYNKPYNLCLSHIAFSPKDDDYCSKGERKEEKNETN